jgi:hypothetical protein
MRRPRKILKRPRHYPRVQPYPKIGIPDCYRLARAYGAAHSDNSSRRIDGNDRPLFGQSAQGSAGARSRVTGAWKHPRRLLLGSSVDHDEPWRLNGKHHSFAMSEPERRELGREALDPVREIRKRHFDRRHVLSGLPNEQRRTSRISGVPPRKEQAPVAADIL